MTTPAELFDIAGRVVLVTGGTRGIGLMIATAFVDGGARVVVSSRNEEACEATAAMLSARGSCIAIPADVASRAGVEKLATTLAQHYDGLDVLVNNAGATWGAPIDEYPAEAWARVLDTNLTGVFELTRLLLPMLRQAASANHPARVINIGSINGLRAPEFESYPYSASKAAVHMLTTHLARRLAGEHITVNAIAPGLFPSRMTAFMFGDDQSTEQVADGIPLGRVGSADDIAGAVVLLASRGGAYITGTVIAVDGGLTACT